MKPALARSSEAIDAAAGIATAQPVAAPAARDAAGHGDTPPGAGRVVQVSFPHASGGRMAAEPADAGVGRVAGRPAPAEVMCTWVKVGNTWQCL